MDTLQLTRLLRTNPLTRRSFRNVVSLDDFALSQKPRTFPSAYVVNLDLSILEGSHWVVYYFVSKNEILFFDSYGREQPIPLDGVKRNKKQYQAFNKNTCPHHCFCFIYHISLGFTLDQYCKLLDTKYDPDLFVQTFVDNLLIK